MRGLEDVLRSPLLCSHARILLAVLAGQSTSEEIAAATGLSRTSVHKYLSALVAAGLMRRAGWTRYEATEAGEQLVRGLAEKLCGLVGGGDEQRPGQDN